MDTKKINPGFSNLLEIFGIDTKKINPVFSKILENDTEKKIKPDIFKTFRNCC